MAKKRPQHTPEPVVIEEIHPEIERRLVELARASDGHHEREEMMKAEMAVLFARRNARDKNARRDGRWQRNACAITGLAAVGYGCWLVAPSVACIVIGVILFGGSVAGMIASHKTTTQRTRDNA